MDRLEPIVQWSLHGASKLRSLGWDEKVIRETKQDSMEPFPELLDFFNRWLAHMKKEGYID
jgi:hypothetical protein